MNKSLAFAQMAMLAMLASTHRTGIYSKFTKAPRDTARRKRMNKIKKLSRRRNRGQA